MDDERTPNHAPPGAEFRGSEKFFTNKEQTMKDFTQTGNQQTDHFADDEAKKTLDTVFGEWQSGKQVLQWTVLQAVSPQESNRMKMLKMGLWGGPVFVVVAAFFALDVLDLDAQERMIFIAAMAVFLVADIFLAIPLTLKAAARNMRNAITVKIDRNKKSAVITIARQQQVEKLKYGAQGVLPVFTLPENDKGGKYAAMRGQLQKQISAETGFLFEEVRQQA